MPETLRSTSMLEVNEFLVLDFVRQHGRTTRVDIAQQLGLSASSVSRIIRRLQSSGSVTEGPGESTGGRPRSVISFNTRAGVVVGVDLGGTKCHGVVADLGGTILADEVRPTSQAGAPYSTLLSVLDALSRRAAALGQTVRALAVGIPAYIDPDTGLADGGPNVHWQGFALSKELAVHVSAPFAVENDANLAALAHAWRGDARDCQDFVVMSIGTGIGAGVVIDGRLVRGRNNAAGEVGYLVLSPVQLGEIDADGLGGFERAASGPAIAAHAEAVLRETQLPSILRAGPVTAGGVFAAAQDGDALALQLVSEVLDHVAIAAIALGAIANPERVILDGSVGRALSPWLDELAGRVAPHLPAPPSIVVSGLGAYATVLGAVAAALQLTRREREPAHLTGILDVRPLQRRRGQGVVVA